MEGIISITALFVLLIVINFLPLNMTRMGKGLIVFTSFLLAHLGLLARSSFSLWQIVSILFLLALLIVYLFEKRLKNLLITPPTSDVMNHPVSKLPFHQEIREVIPFELMEEDHIEENQNHKGLLRDDKPIVKDQEKQLVEVESDDNMDEIFIVDEPSLTSFSLEEDHLEIDKVELDEELLFLDKRVIDWEEIDDLHIRDEELMEDVKPVVEIEKLLDGEIIEKDSQEKNEVFEQASSREELKEEALSLANVDNGDDFIEAATDFELLLAQNRSQKRRDNFLNW